MAFVFRSERNLEYQKDLNQEQAKNNDNTSKKQNFDIILNLQKDEKAKQINKEKLNKSSNSNFITIKKSPFSSNTERSSLIKKEKIPGPGAYNINKLYFDHKRQFSSRESFNDSYGYEYINLPSIRIKSPGNNNPGPGQYNPNEEELFGGKFKKLYNMKSKIKKRNITSKSMSDIFLERKANIDINKIDDMKDCIFVYLSQRKIDSYNKNNDRSSISFSNANNKNNYNKELYYKSNENETLKKNKEKKLSTASLDTQRSSINSSGMTLSNPISQRSKILLSQRRDNYEKKKNFKSNDNYAENDKNFILHTIETDENKIKQIPLFIYDKSKIIKNSQDHERIMSINEDKSINNYFNILDKNNEFLIDQDIFSQTPGPGYYDPIEPVNQQYFNKKNYPSMGIMINNHLKNSKKISPGPGEYKIDNNSIENSLIDKMNKKLNNNNIFDVKKIAKLRIAKEKESLERSKIIKLSSPNLMNKLLKNIYENNMKDFSVKQNLRYGAKKNIKKMLFNFGSNTQRFKMPKQKIPPVGQYNVCNYKSIEEKNENIIKNRSYKELLEFMENKSDLLERSPFNKQIFENPPVGEYNPDIISSIKYNFEYKNKINNQQVKNIRENKGYKKILEKKALQRVKEIKEKEKQLMNFLGPGKYYKMINKHFDLNNNKNKDKDKYTRPAFGIAEDKFRDDNDNCSPGPGEYDLDSYYNWIKTTYNILFF